MAIISVLSKLYISSVKAYLVFIVAHLAGNGVMWRRWRLGG